MQSTISPTFTVSAAHSGRVMMTRASLVTVNDFFTRALVGDASLIRSLEPRESVIVGRGAYRVVRVS